ncbi:MAG: addiction module toxin RelE [Mucilaginibacter sp.]|nr:addiction module toxin RelE [Mucilaginibacter sp.]
MGKILSLPHFDIRFKRLAKKFKTLTVELSELSESLENDPKQGISLGNGLYKVRLASESKGTGKSGGFRIITYYVAEFEKERVVYLVTIYDKSEESSIKKDYLLKIIKSALD